MSKIPDRLYIDDKDRELYQMLSKESSLFRGKINRDQFLFTAAIGVTNNMRIPIQRKENWFLTKDLRPEDNALFNAIALAETESTDILSDKNEIYKIVEEYAHAGIKILSNEMVSVEFGSFHKHLEKQLNDIYSTLAKNINVRNE